MTVKLVHGVRCEPSSDHKTAHASIYLQEGKRFTLANPWRDVVSRLSAGGLQSANNFTKAEVDFLKFAGIALVEGNGLIGPKSPITTSGHWAPA